ncbi:MAG: hypothetical protein HDT33_01600 [Clostridiales bacterium]|nr:hypothetical protein [Clostridiales bacterium]
MYAELIDREIGQVYQKGVATKILQGMDRIRNEFDVTQARRWPTELLQNARDLSESGQPVRVRIELTEDTVRFSHNGKPFSVKDILSIVNQVSSKQPGEGVGQFGTGFMSTFQLSMQVDIRSYLKDGTEPYKPFRVCLDRSGVNQEAITAAIAQALSELKAADTAPPVEALTPDKLNTEFRYHLRDQRSRKTARLGMEDLRLTLPYVLLFSPQIGEVKLVFQTEDRRETITFRRGGKETLLRGLIRHKIMVGSRRKTYFTLEQEGITLAAAWDQKEGFLPLPALAPRLYVDFPLVGSERFPFPVVLNSLALRPNEPRSGVSLAEAEESVDGRQNRTLLDRAAALYQEFVSALLEVDLRGGEHLMTIPPQEERKEWSAAWVRTHLYDRIFDFLSRQPVLPVDGALHSLSEESIRLVRSETAEQRASLRQLWRQLQGTLIPEGETDWYTIFAGYHPPEGKYITIRSALAGAAAAVRRLRPEVDPAAWLARLYDLGMETEETAIRAGELTLFPSQCPEDLAEGRLYTAREIFTDPGIPELLKDAAEELDKLEESGCLELRKRLLHQGFCPQTAQFLPEYSIAELTDYIITRSDRGFRVRGYAQQVDFYNETWANAWSLLLACGPDQELYELCRTGWRTLPEYTGKAASDGEQEWGESARCLLSFLSAAIFQPPMFDRRMWSNACRGVLNLLLEQVQRAKTLDAWTEALNSRTPGTETISWLERFYAKAAQYLRVSELYFTPILPNQYGVFRAPSDLKLDKIEDEDLKAVSICFKEEQSECDVSAVLLDQRLQLSGWNLPVLGSDAVAAVINTALQQFLANTSLSEAPLEIQEACTRLLGWIQEHPLRAQRCFPAFCGEEAQMKLLTPRAAVSLRKKADRFNELLALAGTEDPERLIQLVQEQALSVQPPELFENFDPDSGILLDEDWIGLDNETRNDRLRRIGEAGERCAYQAVVDYFAGQGLQVEMNDGSNAILKNELSGRQVTVCRPDTEDFKQPGWDIFLQIQDGLETASYFLEVKTHTARSRVRSRLPLSDTQMRQAASLGRQYILLLVIYDEARGQAVEFCPFRDIPRQIAEGTLRSASGRFVLETSGLDGTTQDVVPA